jgi:hypothetical protein
MTKKEYVSKYSRLLATELINPIVTKPIVVTKPPPVEKTLRRYGLSRVLDDIKNKAIRPLNLN